MTSLLAFLNANSGAFNVVFSLVVASTTIFYALLTRRLVKETERMRAAQTDPHVAVRLEPSSEWINLILLVVENLGNGPAYDLRLTVSPEFLMERNVKLSEVGLFKHGMPYLAPKQKVTLFLTSIVGQTAEIERPGGKYSVDVNVHYRGILRTTYDHTYPLDLKHMLGMTTIGHPPLQTVAKELEKIQKSLSNLETGWKKLKVDTYTARDREAERLEWEEQREALIDQAERISDEIQLPTDDPLPLANDANGEPAEGGDVPPAR